MKLNFACCKLSKCINSKPTRQKLIISGGLHSWRPIYALCEPGSVSVWNNCCHQCDMTYIHNSRWTSNVVHMLSAESTNVPSFTCDHILVSGSVILNHVPTKHKLNKWTTNKNGTRLIEPCPKILVMWFFKIQIPFYLLNKSSGVPQYEACLQLNYFCTVIYNMIKCGIC